MVSRRGFLAGFAAALGGCSGRARREVGTPTVTPVPVPDTGEDSVGIPVGDSRFGPSTPVPEGVVMFHHLEETAGALVVLSPSRERYTPDAPTAEMIVQNYGADPLFVDFDWHLLKHTGHRWVEIRSSQLDRSGIYPVNPGETWPRSHRIEAVFDLVTLGPGLYARVETARFQDASEDLPPVGALFEVAGTDFEFDPVRPANIEDGVASVSLSDAPSELVFERVDADDPVELVPEAVGANPTLRDSIPYLREVPEVRLRTASPALAAEDIALTTVRDVDVEPGDPLQVGSMTFTHRVAES
ncbi:hypothetical protein [Natronomonas amylolytica]|uniref:hypothetical protein n=1 Tax=Natronomonas amylolytica TaxID=3108498 RepID=UPI00300A4B04